MLLFRCYVMSDSFVTPWTVACQARLSVGLSRQEYGSGLPFPSPGDLPHPGIKSISPAWQLGSLPLSHQGSPSVHMCKKKKPPTISMCRYNHSLFMHVCFYDNEVTSYMLFYNLLFFILPGTSEFCPVFLGQNILPACSNM